VGLTQYTFTKSSKFGDIKDDLLFQLHIAANKTTAKKRWLLPIYFLYGQEKISNIEDDLPFQLHIKNVHIDGRLSPTITGGILVWPVLRTWSSSMVLSIRQTGGSNIMHAQCEIWLQRHWLECRKCSLFTDLFTVLEFLSILWRLEAEYRNRVVVPASQATYACGIGSLESILWLL
jgi:hypothetical protein